MRRILLLLPFFPLLLHAGLPYLPYDTSWEDLLDSKLVARIRVTSSSKTPVKVVVTYVYKGEAAAGDSVWLTGVPKEWLGGTHGEALVFLNRYGLGPDYDKAKAALDSAAFEAYRQALKDGNGYGPTDDYFGSAPIVNGKIAYDIGGSAFGADAETQPYSELDAFLKACFSGEQKEAFCRSLVRGLGKKQSTEWQRRQQLSMLYFLDYRKAEPVFAALPDFQQPKSRIAQIRLLGKTRSEAGCKRLLAFTEDADDDVRYTAMQALGTQDPKLVGPFLLQQLEGFDPNSNEINYLGIRMKAVGALADINYAPALPKIAELLEQTTNFNVYSRIVEHLQRMDGGRAYYAADFNRRLQGPDLQTLAYPIGRFIAKDSLTECLPFVYRYLESCDPKVYARSESMVDEWGLGSFGDSATIAFLVRDFRRVVYGEHVLNSEDYGDWVEEYVKTFARLKVAEVRPLVYKALFDWYGYSEAFGKDPHLFAVKDSLEQAYKARFDQRYAAMGYTLRNCIAYIGNPEKANGFGVQYYLAATAECTGKECYSIIDSLSIELGIPKERIMIDGKDALYNSDHRFLSYMTDFLYPILSYFEAIGTLPEDAALISGIKEYRFGGK